LGKKRNKKHDLVLGEEEIEDPEAMLDINELFAKHGIEFVPDEKIPRPTTIKVFGRQYTINYVHAFAGMKDAGMLDYGNQILTVQENQLPLEEADTILHEVVHAVDLLMELKMSERQVQLVATGLMGVFQDNPEFAKYIIEDKNTLIKE